MNFLSTVIHFLLPYVICILEIMAIIIIAGAGLNAFIRYIQNAFMQKKHDLQSDFAKSMVIGIEFAMAGEILKTVLIRVVRIRRKNTPKQT